VTDINLRNNQISDEGAAALADALKVNTSLTSIRLGYNKIGTEGAAVLADALKLNTSVTTMSLWNNNIDDEGAAALADVLKVNTSVTEIDLNSNRIDKSNHDSIRALVARNKRFRSLFLFNARRMLLSLMYADECGVVWPYLLET
jgi:Ran GTPase-activating protein (RanGAP) involved in mRNA processing and transport